MNVSRMGDGKVRDLLIESMTNGQAAGHEPVADDGIPGRSEAPGSAREAQGRRSGEPCMSRAFLESLGRPWAIKEPLKSSLRSIGSLEGADAAEPAGPS
jgi:hypothetical protein